jgi:hypothetical protein
MGRKIDVKVIQGKSVLELKAAITRYHNTDGLNYLVRRWVAAMTAVEIHSIWERYVENRLIAALNHHPHHFLKEHNIVGVTAISTGFAQYIVRSGGRFFDFRSTSELIGKANRWLGAAKSPFNSLVPRELAYLDCLAAVRNCVVHRSEAAITAYKRNLRSVYSIKAAPAPDEFLHAKDFRNLSPARHQSRVIGLAVVTTVAIART